jgi:uncharacterized protein YndB with AHSA1/START domain
LIAAPPERIYAAFIDAEALMAWLPPAGMTGRVLELEAREGGQYRIELRYGEQTADGAGKTTGRTDVSKGRFVELVPGQRIKQSVEFESNDPAFAGEMMMTWSFRATPPGTMVTVTAENVPSSISKADHDAGMTSSLENLARFVEEAGRSP